MKFIFLKEFLIVIAIFSVLSNSVKLGTNIKEEKCKHHIFLVLEVTGSTNNSNNKSVLSANYSLAKIQNNNRMTSKSNVSFKKPNYVSNIEETKKEWEQIDKPSSVEDVHDVNEISSEFDNKKKIELLDNAGEAYYNGTKNLKYFSSLCSKLNKSKEMCIKQDFCGWCYSSNGCIQGTKDGAVDDCLEGHFIYKGNLI